jgi:hypothetical protein
MPWSFRESCIRKWDCLSAIVLAVIGLAAIYEAVQEIGIGTFAQPDPGFYPFWLAIVLVFVVLMGISFPEGLLI